jgi:hypothetical protein
MAHRVIRGNAAIGRFGGYSDRFQGYSDRRWWGARPLK